MTQTVKEHLLNINHCQFKVGESRNTTAVDTLLDLARNLFPPNLVQVRIEISLVVLPC